MEAEILYQNWTVNPSEVRVLLQFWNKKELIATVGVEIKKGGCLEQKLQKFQFSAMTSGMNDHESESLIHLG